MPSFSFSSVAALAEHLGVRGVQNFVFRDAVSQLQANVARSGRSKVAIDRDSLISAPPLRERRNGHECNLVGFPFNFGSILVG